MIAAATVVLRSDRDVIALDNPAREARGPLTLSVAWIRSVGTVEELIFASDSRLRAGQAWDCCPKIMTLPRTDCLISFAGDTDYAYPLMLQMVRAIDFYPASLNRRTDIAVAKGHALRVFNQMRSLIHDLPPRQDSPGDPAAWFLFGGYSWRKREFRIWTLHYDKDIDRFTFRPVNQQGNWSRPRKFAFIGDVATDAREQLMALLRSRGKHINGGLDMEPFEILRDMIRSNRYPSIGGAPQVAKVYRYMQTQFFAVQWPDNSGAPHVVGRPALSYESFEAPVIDPDAPSKHSGKLL